ncbi:MAG: peptide chain release factor 2 [Solirubrobacteraceae bacterium]
MAATSSSESTPQRLAAIRAQMSLLADYLDPASLVERLSVLEHEMSAPGFWENQEAAAQVSADHARAARRLEQFRSLVTEVEDLDSLADMARDDDEIAAELAGQLGPIEARLETLEEQRLFSGRYDGGDALVTVNAGAGGTDAQDWAEMVLRMQMKWAEKRGFAVELLEVSPGEEAGIKSATFRAAGENAYGLYGAEKGVHRLVRLSPFDSAKRRQTSFAGVEVAPVIEDAGEVEIDSDDLQVDTYRASGAGGQHVNKTDSAVRITHRPSAIVVQCQNERSQTQNRETAMKMLRSKLVEREERRRQEELAKEKGEAQEVNFGSQIRSYVLHPYTMVKDHRTDHELGDAARVLDGDLDGFVRAYLLKGAARG